MVDSTALSSVRIRLDALLASRRSRADLAATRDRRLGRHLAFVTRQSRFYRRHYAEIDRPTHAFEALPPVTKPTLMAKFDDVVTDTAVTAAAIADFRADADNVGRRFLGRYPVWTTSGTTGEPGVFLQDWRSLAVNDAVGDRWNLAALLNVRSVRRLVGQDARLALIAVTGGHYAGAAGIAMYQRENRFLRDRARVFSPARPLGELVDALNAFQPAFVSGYATVLVELAREQREGRLQLSPAIVVPTAEPITAAEKATLRRSFDCTVRELYGATECYAMAVECAHGNLHANTDWVVLEPVDADYRPVEPGTPGDTVLLTNLANRIQPLVRYDLGDRVTLHERPCSCGSPFPTIDVAGRQGDVLRFETAGGESVPVFPLAVSSVVQSVPGVDRSQVVQTGPAALEVRFDLADAADADATWTAVERDLLEFLGELGVDEVTVERGDAPPARDPHSGKFRHVWSEVG